MNSRHRIWGLILMFGLATDAAYGADSTPSTGTIRGRLHCRNDVGPGAYANVIVLGTRLGTQTDDRGIFSIRGVPVGTHQIELRQVGYDRVRTEVTVRAGSDTTIDLELCVASLARDRMIDSLKALNLWPPRLDDRARRRMRAGSSVTSVRIAQDSTWSRKPPSQHTGSPWVAIGASHSLEAMWRDILITAFERGDFKSPALGHKHLCGGFEPGVRVSFFNADSAADSVSALLCYKCDEFSIRFSEGAHQFAFFGEGKQAFINFACRYYRKDEDLMKMLQRHSSVCR